MISVQPDMSAAKAYLNRLQTRDLPKVIGRSLTRTAASGKTFLSRKLRERVSLKKAVIDKAIRTRRSSEIQNLIALELGRAWFEVTMTGKPIALKDFGARSVRRGVSYQVSKVRGRRLYTSKGQPAFIVPRLGGHVFVRKGPDPKGPQKVGIRKVYGPSLSQYFHSKRVQRELIAYCADFWAREIERNARFALSR